jgi:hypothetical protein
MMRHVLCHCATGVGHFHAQNIFYHSLSWHRLAGAELKPLTFG